MIYIILLREIDVEAKNIDESSALTQMAGAEAFMHILATLHKKYMDKQ